MSIPTALEVLRKAAGEIGYREGRDNANKFGDFYGVDNTAWCAQFIYWCIRKAGAEKGQLIPKTAWCPTLLDYARDHKLIVHDPARDDRSGTPRPGDIGLVQRPGQPDGAKHVFFVEKYLGGGKVQTIEGNTSDTGSATGNGVYRLVRKLTDLIVIFRPRYTAPVPPPSGGGGGTPGKRHITIEGKTMDDCGDVSVYYINFARKHDTFSRHVWHLQMWLDKLGFDRHGRENGHWSKALQEDLDRYRRDRMGLDGSDAKGTIGLMSLTHIRDRAKSSKKVKIGKGS